MSRREVSLLWGESAYQSLLSTRSAISSTMGEKSSPPTSGSALRMGAKTGSVSLYTILATGCRRSIRTHDMTTAASTTSEYRSMSVATRRMAVTRLSVVTL